MGALMNVPELPQEILDAVDVCEDALSVGEIGAVDDSLPKVLEALAGMTKAARAYARIAEMYRGQSIYWFNAYTEQAAKRIKLDEGYEPIVERGVDTPAPPA